MVRNASKKSADCKGRKNKSNAKKKTVKGNALVPRSQFYYEPKEAEYVDSYDEEDEYVYEYEEVYEYGVDVVIKIVITTD